MLRSFHVTEKFLRRSAGGREGESVKLSVYALSRRAEGASNDERVLQANKGVTSKSPVDGFPPKRRERRTRHLEEKWIKRKSM